VGPKEIPRAIALITAALSKGFDWRVPATGRHRRRSCRSGASRDTGWPRILALYDLLKRMSGNPMVMLNHAIAAAMVYGPPKGLDLLNALDADGRLPAIIAWTPFVPICWNVRRPSGRDCTLPYRRQPDERACRNGITSSPKPPGSSESTTSPASDSA